MNDARNNIIICCFFVRKYIFNIIFLIKFAGLTMCKNCVFIIFDQIHLIQRSNTIQAFSNTQIPLRKIQIQIHKYVFDPVPGGWTWWVDVVGGRGGWRC